MDATNVLWHLTAATLPQVTPALNRNGLPANSMSTYSQPPEASDADVLSRVAQGDLDAFGQFYDRHSSLLFSLALKILHDHHEAEEALQEAMALIWVRASAYDAALGKPLSWAVTITRNKAIDRLRSAQRKTRLLVDAAHELESGHSSASILPESRVIGGESSTLVRGALVALPPEQRQAIELAFLAGLTQSEIAAQLGEPLGTIKARIRRGMMTLRDALEDKL